MPTFNLTQTLLDASFGQNSSPGALMQAEYAALVDFLSATGFASDNKIEKNGITKLIDPHAQGGLGDWKYKGSYSTEKDSSGQQIRGSLKISYGSVTTDYGKYSILSNYTASGDANGSKLESSTKSIKLAFNDGSASDISGSFIYSKSIDGAGQISDQTEALNIKGYNYTDAAGNYLKLKGNIKLTGRKDQPQEVSGYMTSMSFKTAGFSATTKIQWSVYDLSALGPVTFVDMAKTLLSGSDKITVSATDHPVEVNGYAGEDTIIGSSASDYIVGGAGADKMTGKAGADVFAFFDGDMGLGKTRDIITDFDANSDKLDFSGVAEIHGYIGQNTLGNAGEMWLNKGVLYGSIDGGVDFEISLKGVSELTSNNFIFAPT